MSDPLNEHAEGLSHVPMMRHKPDVIREAARHLARDNERLRKEADKRLEEMDELWKRMTRAELREKRLRKALERIEPLIDAQFEGDSDIVEWGEKVRKLNDALDITRRALAAEEKR